MVISTQDLFFGKPKKLWKILAYDTFLPISGVQFFLCVYILRGLDSKKLGGGTKWMTFLMGFFVDILKL